MIGAVRFDGMGWDGIFFFAAGPDEGDPQARQDGGDATAPRVAQPQRRAVDQGACCVFVSRAPARAVFLLSWLLGVRRGSYMLWADERCSARDGGGQDLNHIFILGFW